MLALMVVSSSVGVRAKRLAWRASACKGSSPCWPSRQRPSERQSPAGGRRNRTRQRSTGRHEPRRNRGRRHRGGARLLRPHLRLHAARQGQDQRLHRHGRPVHQPDAGQRGTPRQPAPFRPGGGRPQRGARTGEGGGRGIAGWSVPRFPRPLGQPRSKWWHTATSSSPRRRTCCAAWAWPLDKTDKARRELAEKGMAPEPSDSRRGCAAILHRNATARTRPHVDAAAVPADHLPLRHRAQPHRRGADVPVPRRGRAGRRLARAASRRTRDGRRRHRVHRGDACLGDRPHHAVTAWACGTHSTRRC